MICPIRRMGTSVEDGWRESSREVMIQRLDLYRMAYTRYETPVDVPTPTVTTRLSQSYFSDPFSNVGVVRK